MASVNLKRRRRWGINHKILDEMGGSGPLFDILPAAVCVRIFSHCEESGSRGAWQTAELCYRFSCSDSTCTVILSTHCAPAHAAAPSTNRVGSIGKQICADAL